MDCHRRKSFYATSGHYLPVLLLCGGASKAQSDQSGSLDHVSHMLHEPFLLAPDCAICGECCATAVVNLSAGLDAARTLDVPGSDRGSNLSGTDESGSLFRSTHTHTHMLTGADVCRCFLAPLRLS